MRFQYQALQRDGRLVSGLIEAPTERGAHRDLLKRGVQPTAIHPARPPRSLTRRPRRNLSPRHYVSVLKQMHALISGGVPIAEAIAALAEVTTHPTLTTAYAELNASLRRGEPFPRAFAQSFAALPPHIHQMIAAGDIIGRAGDALADAAAELEREAKIRSELRQALVYPCFLVGFGVLAVLFIFIIVVPRFAVMFQGRLDKVPMLSYLVIATGMWFRQHLLLALVVLVGAGLVVAYGLLQQRSRQTALLLLSRLPIVRNWWDEVETARWAAILARLLENRVPLIQSLELARTALRGRDIQLRLARVERDVRAGATLAAALDDSVFLAPAALTLIRVGERSSKLPEMVRSIAAIYEDTVRRRTRVALAIIEPVAIVLIGGVIGLIAVAIFLAITSINNVPGL
jgi:general secretion pathway protein F